MTRKASERDDLAQLQKFAKFLDSSIELPGGYRIGFDGLVGLIPGIGDAAGACAGSYIIVRAAQMGASTATLIRMMGNLIIEVLVGAIPVLGDLFDFVWKANNRNVALLGKQVHRFSTEKGAKQRLTAATLTLIGAFLLLLTLLLVGIVSLLISLSQRLGAG